MRSKKFNVPIYNYDIFMYQIETVEDVDAITRVIKKFHIDEIIDEVTTNIIDEVDGGALTCFNAGTSTAVVIFYPCSDPETWESVLDHEKRHIVDDILERCGVNDKEAAAYLSGWMTTKFKI
jgi:hypothetical protein